MIPALISVSEVSWALVIRQENSQVANSFENYQTVGKNVPRSSRASLQRRHYLRPSFSAACINVFASFKGLMPGVRIKMLMGNNLSAAWCGKREVFPCLGALPLGFKCHFQRGAAAEMPERRRRCQTGSSQEKGLAGAATAPAGPFGQRGPPRTTAPHHVCASTSPALCSQGGGHCRHLKPFLISFYPSDLNSKKKKKKQQWHIPLRWEKFRNELAS